MKFTTIAWLLPFAAAVALPEHVVEDALSSNFTKPQCGPRVVSLATGIHINIGGQHAELNATKSLQRIEAASPINMDEFEIGKGKLLADIATGMTIRKYNQAVAPKHNPAVPGLNKYAAAQGAEQKLAKSLTGDPAHDKKVLATLVDDIKNGTDLNKQNLKDATEHCQLGFTFPA